MEYNETYFPVSQATPGKLICGKVMTCKGCGLQVILTSSAKTHLHRWWERLGWGKISTTLGRGKSGKGDLYCPSCFPKAHAVAVGEGQDYGAVEVSGKLDNGVFSKERIRYGALFMRSPYPVNRKWHIVVEEATWRVGSLEGTNYVAVCRQEQRKGHADTRTDEPLLDRCARCFRDWESA